MLKLSKYEIARQLRLYAVTDDRWVGSQTLMQQIEAALQGGITMLQLREKKISPEKFLAEAIAVKKLTDKYNIPLIINDNLSVACQSNASGLHIGQKDGSVAEARHILGANKILGVSAQNVEQAKAAEAAGADYLGVGAVFTTSTKNDAEALSPAILREICQSVKIPVVAIGGITAANLPTLLNSGIAGVAVVSAIFAQENITAASRRLLEILQPLH